MNPSDRENVVKASQTVNLLIQDLKELVDSDDTLIKAEMKVSLSDFATEMYGRAILIERRLKRIQELMDNSCPSKK